MEDNQTESLERYLQDLIYTKKECSDLLKYAEAELAQKQIEEIKTKIKNIRKKELRKNHKDEVILN